jgi:hypothetical protein
MTLILDGEVAIFDTKPVSRFECPGGFPSGALLATRPIETVEAIVRVVGKLSRLDDSA